VAKPSDVAREWSGLGERLTLSGNGLHKYLPLFAEAVGDGATVSDERFWTPCPEGLFRAFVAARSAGGLGSGDCGEVLPIYTRLSDAEEAEAVRRGLLGQAPPSTGVAGDGR
jgi:N6-L-threonylcarbamoyladenine synthase